LIARVVGGCTLVNYTLIYTNEVFDMKIDDCYTKAEDAVRMGIIEFDKLDAYAKHLYEKHRHDGPDAEEDPRFREPWHNRS